MKVQQECAPVHPDVLAHMTSDVFSTRVALVYWVLIGKLPHFTSLLASVARSSPVIKHDGSSISFFFLPSSSFFSLLFFNASFGLFARTIHNSTHAHGHTSAVLPAPRYTVHFFKGTMHQIQHFPCFHSSLSCTNSTGTHT